MTSGEVEPVVLRGEQLLETARSIDVQRSFPMSRRDWKRLREKAEQIRPTLPLWGFGAALFAGVAIPCIINWILALAERPMKPASIYVNAGFGLACAVLAILCLMAERQQQNRATKDAQDLLREMDWVEQEFPTVFPQYIAPTQAS